LKLLRSAAPFLVVGALWEAVAHSGAFPARLFPSLEQVAATFARLTAEGILPHHAALTLYRLAAGFAIAAVAGVALGIVMGRSRRAEAFLLPLVSIGAPIPGLAYAPLFLLWFGLGDVSKIVTIPVGVLFLVLVNTMTGVKAINPLLIKAAHDLGASRLQIFVKVILPGALPNIFTGLRLGAGMALILVFITEIEATKAGLGYLLWEAFQLLETKDVFAGVVTFGLLGVATTWLLQWIERTACPWARR